MTHAILRFVVRLRRDELDELSLYSINGPIFHRWLPDGEADALVLDTTDANARLKVWFDRTGFLETAFGNLIRFDPSRREVDPEIVAEQAMLDAGPIRGLLTIELFDPVIAQVLRDNRTNDDEYVAFGKRVVKLLYEPLATVIEVLRIRYGQYWIAPLERWDSRTRTLGAYCISVLHLEYTLDEDMDWRKFLPDDPIQHAYLAVEALGPKTVSQYLTKSDWLEVERLTNEQYKPTLSALTLISALELMETGRATQSIIEGVTALELAIGELVRTKLAGRTALVRGSEAFWTLSLPARLIIAATFLGRFRAEEVEGALSAIRLRNDIVHEGRRVTEEDDSVLRALLVVAAKLIHGTRFRLPLATDLSRNVRQSSERWEALMSKPAGGDSTSQRDE